MTYMFILKCALKLVEEIIQYRLNFIDLPLLLLFYFILWKTCYIRTDHVHIKFVGCKIKVAHRRQLFKC